MTLALSEPTARGGKRKKAGRKPVNGVRQGLPHVARPFHEKSRPVHVTLPVVAGLRSLRERRLARNIGNSIRRATVEYARRRSSFRVIHFSIQPAHIHLVVEAGSKTTLSRGLQGLEIRIAKRLNGELNRGGRVFRDRYHARELASPIEVRHCIAYVLCNFRHHTDATDRYDPCSSARWFDGWTVRPPPQDTPSPVAAPLTWLAATGWRRHGLLRPTERPAS